MHTRPLVLDSGGRHVLGYTSSRFELRHHHGDRRSRLHEALLRHLTILFQGSEQRHTATFDVATASVERPNWAQRAALMLGRHSARSVATWTAQAGWVSGGVLSPFEARYLAEHGQPHPGDATEAEAGLCTDLHTHFAGCIRAPDLLEIGLSHAVRYPSELLAQAGIQTTAASTALADLPPPLLHALERRLEIPHEGRIPFLGLEAIYRLRSPITKDPKAFWALCSKIAYDYKRMGVTYAELSLSNVVEASRLRIVHDNLDALEQETGVRLRFLAAMSRHDDLEWDLDYIARIASLQASHAVVGVDFMGHETNSTRAFARQIHAVASWATAHRPGFVIRVHAGENPAHPENIREVLEIVAGHAVQLRIGHGLYGVDEATLDALKQRDAIVEFNLSSNFALNNVQSGPRLELRRYLDHGISVVLGSDGYGIYQTTLPLEARAAAVVCGLTSGDFEAIRATERRYLEQQAADEAQLRVEAVGWQIPPDPPPFHFTEAIAEQKRQQAAQRNVTLLRALKSNNITCFHERSQAIAWLGGRRCISFAGAWKHSWAALSDGEQQQVRRVLSDVAEALDPTQTVFITGGTQFGVEALVQRLAAKHAIPHLGVMVWETPPEALCSHANQNTQTAWISGVSLHDKAAGLYTLVRDIGGLCVFVGGGNIVNDEILIAANLRLEFLLMDSVSGASAEHTSHRTFQEAHTVLSALDQLGQNTRLEPFWYKGANPTVDIVVVRRLEMRTEVLLIRRDMDAPAESGIWALPGGFVQTLAPRGASWRPGVEQQPDAVLRELLEETGLDLGGVRNRLVRVGVYEGSGRDPRDREDAWSCSTLFAVDITDTDAADAPIAGGDDASDAAWFDRRALPSMAFDHARLLEDALYRVEHSIGR